MTPEIYPAYSCPNCGEPHYWNNKIVSQKTGKKIPLNKDGTYHYKTCAAASRGAEPQQEQQQQLQQQQPVTPLITSTSGPETWEQRLGLLNGQMFARLDRIDSTIKQIARAIDGINEYFQRKDKEEADQYIKENAEARYDQDKEDGLI